MPDEKAPSLLAVTRQQVSGATGIVRCGNQDTTTRQASIPHSGSAGNLFNSGSKAVNNSGTIIYFERY